MRCKHLQCLLDRHFDDGTTPGHALQEHLDVWAECSRHWSALQELDAAMRGGPDVEADPALVARIQSSTAAQSAPRQSHRYRWAASIAAVAMVPFITMSFD